MHKTKDKAKVLEKKTLNSKTLKFHTQINNKTKPALIKQLSPQNLFCF